jgi:hypothetical protein
VGKKFKGLFVPRKTVSPLRRAFARCPSVTAFVTLPHTAQSKPVALDTEDTTTPDGFATMRFNRSAASSKTEASLTSVNGSFKADAVLAWFRGDLETTQPPLGCVEFWPRPAREIFG